MFLTTILLTICTALWLQIGKWLMLVGSLGISIIIWLRISKLRKNEQKNSETLKETNKTKISTVQASTENRQAKKRLYLSFRDCFLCGEEILGIMTYCPYCGANQSSVSEEITKGEMTDEKVQ